MKKFNKSKLAAFAAATLIVNGVTAVSALAAQPPAGEEIITPQNIAIASTFVELSKVSGNTFNCYGKTAVNSNYKANVIVELQQLDGGWKTIKTWTANGGATATVDENYTVTSGYSYRLRVTHNAFNSSGALVESIVTYGTL